MGEYRTNLIISFKNNSTVGETVTFRVHYAENGSVVTRTATADNIGRTGSVTINGLKTEERGAEHVITIRYQLSDGVLSPNINKTILFSSKENVTLTTMVEVDLYSAEYRERKIILPTYYRPFFFNAAIVVYEKEPEITDFGYQDKCYSSTDTTILTPDYGAMLYCSIANGITYTKYRTIDKDGKSVFNDNDNGGEKVHCFGDAKLTIDGTEFRISNLDRSDGVNDRFVDHYVYPVPETDGGKFKAVVCRMDKYNTADRSKRLYCTEERYEFYQSCTFNFFCNLSEDAASLLKTAGASHEITLSFSDGTPENYYGGIHFNINTATDTQTDVKLFNKQGRIGDGKVIFDNVDADTAARYFSSFWSFVSICGIRADERLGFMTDGTGFINAFNYDAVNRAHLDNDKKNTGEYWGIYSQRDTKTWRSVHTHSTNFIEHSSPPELDPWHGLQLADYEIKPVVSGDDIEFHNSADFKGQTFGLGGYYIMSVHDNYTSLDGEVGDTDTDYGMETYTFDYGQEEFSPDKYINRLHNKIPRDTSNLSVVEILHFK